MIRRLSRVADSTSPYEGMRPRRWGRGRGRGRRSESPPTAAAAAAAQGHVPVFVGEEMERFEVRAELLNEPPFVELLRRTAQEYGYEQRGVLRIPCPVPLFRRVLWAVGGGGGREGKGDEEGEELLRSFDEWFLSSDDSPNLASELLRPG